MQALSARQREILGLLERGLTNREIAGVLAISIATVKAHLANLYVALGVTNRTEAVGLRATRIWQTSPSVVRPPRRLAMRTRRTGLGGGALARTWARAPAAGIPNGRDGRAGGPVRSRGSRGVRG